MRVLRELFAIYRFSTESGMDLDEDIPALLMWQGTCYLLGRKEHGKKTKAVGV